MVVRSMILASLLLHGCYASHALDGSGPLEHDDAFADDWRVVAAFGWALRSTSTVYRFHADGEIEVIEHHEGDYFDGEAGQWRVSGDDGEVVCAFGDRWWSEADRLFIESDCDDGTTAALELVSIEDASNARTFALDVVGPEGAVGFWQSDAIDGSLERCREGC